MALLKTCTGKGFTLIEILVVIGLLSVVGGFTMLVSLQSFQSSSFRNQRDQIVSILYRARSRAVNNMCLGTSCVDGKPHGVHFDAATKTHTLFQGERFFMRDTAIDQVFTPSYAITFGPGSITDVVFAQLSGDATTTPAGSWALTLVDPMGKTSTITFGTEGQIQWD